MSNSDPSRENARRADSPQSSVPAEEPPLDTVKMMALAGVAFSIGLAGSLWFTRQKSTRTRRGGIENQHAKVIARMTMSQVQRQARTTAFKSLAYATGLTLGIAGAVALGVGKATGTSNMREFSEWLQHTADTRFKSLKSKSSIDTDNAAGLKENGDQALTEIFTSMLEQEQSTSSTESGTGSKTGD
ncbi:hypothetical protein IWQ62_003825 [Dispira parvispora]|uniref:Transmembrane protein 242 n=1 Tax=Dispira parvispora TaxID=1520584 RepID=A0A9W8AQ72_9FUNG|nr:hypothetical protein IWQ62_003825 [Dispira parvispora]